MAQLSIPDEVTHQNYTVVAAQTVFPFDFAIFAKADLCVSVNGVELTQGDFTLGGTLLDGGGYQGGTVILNSPVADSAVVVWRDIAAQRAAQFAPAVSVPVRAIDQALNRDMAIAQDMKAELGRSIRLPAGSSAEVLGTDRANKVVGFDAAGKLALFSSASAITAATNVSYLGPLGDALPVAEIMDNRLSLNAKDLGAAGNGLWDDRPKIQAAIDYLSGIGGGLLDFGPGNYMVGAPLLMRDGVTLRGCGKSPYNDGSVPVLKKGRIRPMVNMAAVITQADPSSPLHSMGLRDLCIDARYEDGIQVTNAVYLRGINSEIRGCQIENGYGVGVYWVGGASVSWINWISDNSIGGFLGDCVTFEGTDTRISDNYVSGGYHGIRVTSTGGVTITGNQMELSAGYGLVLESGSDYPLFVATVDGNYFAENQADVWLRKGAAFASIDAYVILSNNNFHASQSTSANVRIDSAMKNGVIYGNSFSSDAALANIEFGGAGNDGWTIGENRWSLPRATRFVNLPPDCATPPEYREYSLADFGALASTADNAAAFAAAEASAYPRIYVPQGTFSTSRRDYQLNKTYYGPGKIVDTVGGSNLPGNFAYLVSEPSRGTGSDLNYYFSGSASFSNMTYRRIGAGLRQGLDQKYFESVTTPEFEVFQNGGGHSGTSCHLTAAYVTGNTVTVDNTDDITVGQTVGFNPSGSLANPAAYVDRRVVTSKTSTTLTWTTGGNLSSGYPIGTVVSRAARTMNAYRYQELRHEGGGDAYISVQRLIVKASPKAGQTHVFETATAGIDGGDISFVSSGGYATGREIGVTDNGYDVAYIGDVRSMKRDNDTGALGAMWLGSYKFSYGIKAINAFDAVAGAAQVGYDTVRATLSTKAALNMAQDQWVVFDSLVDGADRFPLYGKLAGKTRMGKAADGWLVLQVDNGGASYDAIRIGSNGRVVFGNVARLKSYAVASLPAGAAGDTAFASNGRAFNGTGTLEGAGAGTGVSVTHNGTAWKITGTNVTVSA